MKSNRGFHGACTEPHGQVSVNLRFFFREIRGCFCCCSSSLHSRPFLTLREPAGFLDAIDSNEVVAMEWISDPSAWIGLLTLSALEIVLGIDNVIFISILSGKLPAPEQPKARRLGLGGAFVTRILLLLSIAWIV